MEQNTKPMVTVRDVLEFYFRHQFRILFIFFFTTLSVIALVYYFPEEYEVAAKLLVKIDRETDSVSLTATQPSLAATGNKITAVLNSEIAVLESTYLAEKLVSEIGPDFFQPPRSEPNTPFAKMKAALAGKLKTVKRTLLKGAYRLDIIRETTPFEKAVLGFSKDLRVVTGDDSSIITLIYKTPHAAIGQEAMARYIQLYLDHRMKIHESKSAYLFFGEQVSMYEKALEEAQARLESYQRERGVVSAGDYGKLLLDRLMSVRAQQHECQVKISELKARIGELEAQIAKLSDNELVSKEVRRNPLLDFYKQQLADLTLRKSDLEQKYLAGSPLLEAVNKSIAEIDELLTAAEGDVVYSTVTAPYRLAQLLEQQRVQCRIDLTAEESRLAGQEAMRAALEREMQQCIADESVLKDRTRDVAINEDNYLLYKSKAEEARIQDALDQNRIASIQVAAPPTSSIVPLKKARYVPRKIYYVMIAMVCSLVLAVLYSLTLDYFDHTIHTKADIERYLEIPVLGTFFRDNRLRRVIRDVRAGR